MVGGQRAFLTRLVFDHLQQTNEETKRAFVERYERRLFPLPQITTAQTMWRSYRNIVRVTFWGWDHFRNNVRAAMVPEALGLGPR